MGFLDMKPSLDIISKRGIIKVQRKKGRFTLW